MRKQAQETIPLLDVPASLFTAVPHEPHPEVERAYDGYAWAPNLILWNGRTHHLVFEFKGDEVVVP